MKVAFIGLGRMGQAMAGRLQSAGHELTVYNRTRAKCADLEKAGGKSPTRWPRRARAARS